jgi:hypothetical protein
MCHLISTEKGSLIVWSLCNKGLTLKNYPNAKPTPNKRSRDHNIDASVSRLIFEHATTSASFDKLTDHRHSSRRDLHILHAVTTTQFISTRSYCAMVAAGSITVAGELLL